MKYYSTIQLLLLLVLLFLLVILITPTTTSIVVDAKKINNKKQTFPPSPYCDDRNNRGRCKYKKNMFCSKACREGPYGKDVFCGKGKLDVKTDQQPEGTCCECDTLTTPLPKCSMASSCSSANGLTCQEECTTANKKTSGWYCGPDWGEVIQAQFKPCCEC
jgi:hypothetical protein